MATATDTPLDVEITLIDIGPCAKQIKFNIPAKAIDTRLSDALSALAGEAAVPGFRKGKAPRGLIEKKFGANLLNEARGQIMSDAYQRALDENKLRPISEPRPVTGEVVAELQRGKSFTFSVEIEIAPEFAVPDFTSYEVKKPTIEVTQEHIDGEILRQSYRWGAPARRSLAASWSWLPTWPARRSLRSTAHPRSPAARTDPAPAPRRARPSPTPSRRCRLRGPTDGSHERWTEGFAWGDSRGPTRVAW